MEKLTISKFGKERSVSGTKDGRSYSFKSIGFLTNEVPDRWYNFAFNGNNPLEVGKQYEFEITERQYKNENGDLCTGYNVSFPKKTGGMSDNDRALIKSASENAYAANVNAQKCYTMLTGLIRDLTLDGVIKEHTSDGKPVPNFDIPPSKQPDIV